MKIDRIEREPTVSVGLMTGVESVSFELKGAFALGWDDRFDPGAFRAAASGGRIEISSEDGGRKIQAGEFRLAPVDASASFVVRDVTIGVDFHWQRKQDQEFQSALVIKRDSSGRMAVINEIPIEAYLASVISSEMSARSHPDLLKAHAIISRSWLLAQIEPWASRRRKPAFAIEAISGEKQLIRWYDRENHTDFDVCADDHCQRYQGVTRASSAEVFDAVRTTCGQTLVYDEELCDARFSKSCGGMTESFDAAWDDRKLGYLAASYDGEQFPAGFELPLSLESNAEKWIRNSPPAFCNTNDTEVISKILPDFDQETANFYRWRVTIAQEDLQRLLGKKLGIDFGAIRSLEPVERGASGRIVRLSITGERESMIIGKELEIRRALSDSHLHSSAFVVEAAGEGDAAPSQFSLIGAGWGHGVGLCQIGAAVMAERGFDFRRILDHYYRGAKLYELYSHGHGVQIHTFDDAE
jgi:SpoIID/LytB domain protein